MSTEALISFSIFAISFFSIRPCRIRDFSWAARIIYCCNSARHLWGRGNDQMMRRRSAEARLAVRSALTGCAVAPVRTLWICSWLPSYHTFLEARCVLNLAPLLSSKPALFLLAARPVGCAPVPRCVGKRLGLGVWVLLRWQKLDRTRRSSQWRHPGSQANRGPVDSCTLLGR